MDQDRQSPQTKRRRVLAQSAATHAALELMLTEGLTQRQPVDRALAAYLREHKHYGSRDRRLISAIVYGTFRWWGWLRHLAPPSSPVQPAEPAAWSAVMLGAALLESSDDREMLDLWREQCGIGAAAAPAGIRQSDSPLDHATALFAGLRRSDLLPLKLEALVPEWTLSLVECPRPADEWIGWLQRRPPLWLRLQGPAESVLGELRDAGLEPKPDARIGGAVCIRDSRVNLFTLPVYRARRVEVQDLASQAVGQVCAPRPGERWWDACAGGGGKTLLLAQLMQGRGTVVATDIREHKLQEVRHRARLAGFQNVATRAWNGKALSTRQATFDGVLVDAPCSGSGTWRRNPWARWSLRAEDLAELNVLQRRILRNAATGVRPGGVLAYATCSMFPAENDDVVRTFLAEHPDFLPEPFSHPFGEGQTDGTLQIWPWDGDCDAMYVARLRRR